MISRTKFGEKVNLYRITNSWGEYAEFLDYGASLHSLYVFDRMGELGDVVLGAGNPKALGQFSGEGVTVGRCANRIADGRFEVDGRVIQLERGAGGHCLHSGSSNVARRYFEAQMLEEENKIVFSLLDPGECGYGCGMKMKVAFSFADDHRLSIEYEMEPEGTTLLSPTNHAYFNLGCEDARDHFLTIRAEEYAVRSGRGLPEGQVAAVAGTPYDFRQGGFIRKAMEGDASGFWGGKPSFDDNYILDGEGFREVAEMSCSRSGRSMKVLTDMPGMVLYVPCFEKAFEGKKGRIYQGYTSVCLETQYISNAVNCPGFKQPVFRAGEKLCSRTVYAFACEK